ncbi:MAG: S-methyl-5-thioribose kinase [Rubrimonas sp.]
MSLDTPPGYRAHTPETLRDWAATLPELQAILGGDPAGWTVEEVGDGNLNLVFKLRGPAGGVAVKQALPYVRLVGESWPLPLSRAHYEHMALVRQAACAPGLPPRVIRHEAEQALIVMELLEPHVIMRRGMIAGTVYPGFAAAMATFCARTLFLTSDLGMPAADKKALIADFAGNTALCRITEDLIFTDPYRLAEGNRWTSPQLDGWAAAIRGDAALKAAVSRLKLKFLSSAEALLHGDLHTGSVMVTEAETRVIDPEFAFVGPMGFDLGAVIANLLINFFSQRGHEDRPGGRDAYRAWVLETVEAFWSGFRAEFLALWRAGGDGDAWPRTLFDDPAGAAQLAAEQEAFMDRLFADAVGFAAAKMIRRILGLAHNIDLEWIADADLRAGCEARVLAMARSMMLDPGGYPDAAALTAEARAREAAPSPGP